MDNRGLAEPLDEGYSPPEKWSVGQGYGNTPLEEELGERQRELRALGREIEEITGDPTSDPNMVPAPGKEGADILPRHRRQRARSGARVHTVRRGETLTGLAKRYRVSVQALREANGMSAGDALRAGVTLRIPG